MHIQRGTIMSTFSIETDNNACGNYKENLKQTLEATGKP